MTEAKEEIKKTRPGELKVDISAILFLDARLFGPLMDGRTTLDYYVDLTNVLLKSSWIKRAIVKGFAFPKE